MNLSELKSKIEQSITETTAHLRKKFAHKEEAIEAEAEVAENQIQVVNRYKLLAERAEHHARTFNQMLQMFSPYEEEVFHKSIVENFDHNPPMENRLRYEQVVSLMIRQDAIHRHSEKIIAAARLRYIDGPMKELETYAKTHALTLKAFGLET